MAETYATCTTDEGTWHANYSDTGRRGINPLTGTEYQVWECECTAKEIEVYPR